jgi:hypothetical protein
VALAIIHARPTLEAWLFLPSDFHVPGLVAAACRGRESDQHLTVVDLEAPSVARQLELAGEVSSA